MVTARAGLRYLGQKIQSHRQSASSSFRKADTVDCKSKNEYSGLLGCYSVSTVKQLLEFRSRTLPPFSR